MAAADVRDMLDLPAEGQQQPRPQKKQKAVEKRPEGITRELFALLGERAPPIAINENRYKGRPKWMSKLRVRPWQMSTFTNEARSDGLVLRHWQRQPEPTKTPALEGTEVETEEEKKETEEEASKPSGQEYPFAKYNVKAKLANRYSDEEYNRHLKSNDWSREETDYLMDLVEEYGLRWVVIADRYDFKPQSHDADSDANALVPAEAHRTMEQMKSRYYSIAAAMLALEHPPSEMSEAEFELHEKMLKFDPDRERLRKELASLQLNRTADEVREEGILLEELKRITSNEQNFIAERRELYSRLEVPISVGNTTMYQSSQGLSQLLSTLLQADKSKKRRSLLGPEGAAAAAAASGAGGAAPSPAGQTPTTTGPPNSARDSQADTPSQTGTSAAPTKKAAAAAAAAANNNKETQPLKSLSPAEEAKYGVQHHERLTPSVQFRTDRAQKLTQAKSNVQSQKLAAALAELEIPLRLVMPTERVCKEFEALIQSVNLLLDARKTAEKVEGEIRVLEAAKEDRERKEKGTTAEVKTEDQDSGLPQADGSGAQADENDESTATAVPGDGNETGDAAAAASNGGTADGGEKGLSHKRSASVMSNGSDKSTKRQRK